MAELTAEQIRLIVKEELTKPLKELETRMEQGFASVIESVQRMSDEGRDEFVGIRGRIANHNEPIAKIERLNGLR